MNLFGKFMIGSSLLISLNSSCVQSTDKESKIYQNTKELSWGMLAEKDQLFLDMVQKKAFDYFWDGFDDNTGLIGDPDKGKRTSVATSGFGLSAYCVGIKRGWVTREEVYRRVLITLNSYHKDPNNINDFCVEGLYGFFYHFINVETGQRHGKCEVSTIDTAILMAGILHVMEVFKGTEVEELAKKIYLRAQWDKFIDKKGVLTGGWKPEEGIIGHYKGYNEYSMVYLLGMGSPSYPISASSWDVYFSGNGGVFIKPYKDIGAFLTPGGLMQPHAYLYQFPACWYDFKGKEDNYINHWDNAVNALKANKRYTNNWGAVYDYPEELWGWTACAGRDGYIGFSKPYNGTLAPSAVVASLPFLPEESLRAAKYMYEKYGDRIFGKYGFVDSFNPMQDWYDDGFLGIDKGNEVLMIENFRSGMMWKEFMQNKYVIVGMQKAKMRNI